LIASPDRTPEPRIGRQRPARAMSALAARWSPRDPPRTIAIDYPEASPTPFEISTHARYKPGRAQHALNIVHRKLVPTAPSSP